MDHHPNILIVDRDAVAAHVLSQTLQRHGHASCITANPDEAIETLQRARSVGDKTFGVVLVDQDSNRAQGLALVRRLHDDWPGVVPVMVSAYRKVESAVQAMRLGAADYLLKPVAEVELLDAVGRAVQRHLLLVEHATAQTAIEQKVVTHQRQDKPTGHDGQHDTWFPMPLSEAMKDPEKRILLAALEANGWNRGETARQLDINRTTLYKKIRQYRLDEPA